MQKAVGSSNRVVVKTHSWRTLSENPKYFLYSIDDSTNSFYFLESDEQILSESAFLDGRTALTSNSVVHEVPIDETLEEFRSQTYLNQVASSQGNGVANRFVFHVSFCGSTLLAKTLHLHGRTFSYKEPQIVLQLAVLKSLRHPWYLDKTRWRNLISFVLQQFKLPWRNNQVNIIKPSNWVNTILPELVSDGGDSKVVFLSTDRQNFLESAFRGGGERLQFIYSILHHMHTAFPRYSGLLKELEQSSLETADLFARVTLLLHEVQLQSFSQVQKILPAENMYRCSYQDLVTNSFETVNAAARTLKLDFTESEISKSIVKNFSYHSKVSTRPFNRQQSLEVDSQVNAQYHNNFSAALDWADRKLYSEQLSR